jgi:hypothetical protein
MGAVVNQDKARAVRMTLMDLSRGKPQLRSALDAFSAEFDRLQAWNAEAAAALAAWEQVWEAAGRPGRLGTSKPEQTAAEVLRLRAAVVTQADTVRGLMADKEELRALLAGCDAGQSAPTCRVKLRLISDAMRATCTDRRECVAIDHEPGCPMGGPPR